MHLDLFVSSNVSIQSALAFPELENSDYVVVSVSIDFPSNLKGMPLFITQLITLFVLIEMAL